MLTLKGIEEGDELACKIIEKLDFRIGNDGIGSYEYWGNKETDNSYSAELQESEITVALEDSLILPISGTASKTVGGCDGEHPGRCKPSCTEYEVTIELSLKSAKKEKNQILATYDVKEV